MSNINNYHHLSIEVDAGKFVNLYTDEEGLHLGVFDGEHDESEVMLEPDACEAIVEFLRPTPFEDMR